MNFSEMYDAVDDAKKTLRIADRYTYDMAKIIKGRLRSITSYAETEVLCDLKKELRDFNMTTRTWRR